MAAWSIGMAQRALDMIVEYAPQRVTFGQPLSERQAIQWWVADAATRIHASRLMTYDCAWKLDQGRDVRLEISMIKAFATEMAWEVVDHAMQTFGAMGMTKEMPLQLMAAKLRTMRIYDGPTEVHKWVVARNLLGTSDEPQTRVRYGDITTAGRGPCGGARVRPAAEQPRQRRADARLADALFEASTPTLTCAPCVLRRRARCSAPAPTWRPDGVGGEGMRGINPLYVEAVRLFSAKKPIVAAIQGAAVGAGLGLALVADFRVAAPEARFTANFVKLGFHPGFGITHTLPRLIGQQRAALMLPDRPADQGRRGPGLGPGRRGRRRSTSCAARRSRLAARDRRERAAGRAVDPRHPARRPGRGGEGARPTTNWSNRPGCAKPRTSPKASAP